MRGLFSFFLSIYTAISMFKALIHGILCPQEHQSSTKCILHISFPAISFNLFNKLIACFNHYHHLMWLNVQYLSPIVLWQMLSQPQGKDFSHCVSSKSIWAFARWIFHWNYHTGWIMKIFWGEAALTLLAPIMVTFTSVTTCCFSRVSKAPEMREMGTR
jgi:hypothetical protein